jgi:hypothetical protein
MRKAFRSPGSKGDLDEWNGTLKIFLK